MGLYLATLSASEVGIVRTQQKWRAIRREEISKIETMSNSPPGFGTMYADHEQKQASARDSYKHCAKNVVYDSVYFCVYFAYTINIPRVVYITNIHLVYFKNPQVTIIHCAYSRSIKNTQTTMNLQIR